MSGKEKKEERKEERAREEHTLGGGSMMDNISRLIPSPQRADGDTQEHADSDEGDW